MINLWRPYPLFRPKQPGRYLCTCKHGFGIGRPRVMELYFKAMKDENGKWNYSWTNLERQSVFMGYSVYESCRAPIDDNRVYSDTDCERIDITAWKKLPRPCIFWKKG